jgi:RHS repeat-associated protein
MPVTTVVKDAQGRLAYFSYAGEYIETHKDSLGRVWAYDDRWADTDPLGYTRYFEYDDSLRLLYTGGAGGYGTYFQYASTWPEFVAAVTDALGYTGYFWHDAAGRQTAQVAADGLPTYFAYDLLGRQVAVTDALGSSTYYQYDLAGQQTTQVDALANATYFYYDVLGRQQAVRDAADGLAYYQYDALGRRVALKDQRGYASYFGYDVLSRLAYEVDPLGNVTYYQYAADGSLIARTDGKGQTAYFQHDQVGRLTAMLSPADEASYFSYNLRGDMSAALNGRGNPTYFGYDLLSRLASETDGVGDSSYYAYDPAGHLTDRLDGEGRWAQWSYDAIGRRVAAAYQDGAYAYFTFDAAGRPTAMRDTWGESQYLYDSVGRLTGRRWPDGKCVYYEYDAASNVTALKGPDGGTTYYQYGPLGRMQSIHTARGGWVYYDYDPAGHCIRRHNPNGTLAYFSYDEVGRISSLRNLKGDMSPLSYFDYLYDEAGLVTSLAREGGVTIYYGYDAASRLTGETWQGPAGTLYGFAYGYDPAGNRAWKDIGGTLTYYTYDAAERLLHELSEAKYTYYSYDKNGSCTRIEAPDDGKYTYFEYNDARLLKVAHVLPDDRWNYFHYDGQLTRYCIEDSLGCQYYYWDGLNLLERDNLTTGAARAFTHGHAPVPGIANMVEYAEGDDSYDFHYDVRGTVQGITDADQDVAQAYEHDAWGVKLSEAGALENPIQYQGCAWLTSCDHPGKYDSPAREYLASHGRFLAREPLRRLFCDYMYVQNDPIGSVDPTGLFGYRACCLFAQDQITDASLLGKHESNRDGIVFTCRCGWLDTGHIRQTMDLVLKFYLYLKQAAKKGTQLRGFEMQFTLLVDIAPEDLVTVAASLAYDEAMIHEIVSYNYPPFVYGMFNSAFSPEDLPSNTVGAYLAMSALTGGGPWNAWTVSDLGKADKLKQWGDAMDKALGDTLKECEALPQDKARRVWANYVQDRWVTGQGLSITLLKRSMDFEPWNIVCPACASVKDKSVPAWLAKGTALTRDVYQAPVDIPAVLKQIREDIERRFGKEHLKP